jgi:ABC-type sugar transport system permease subunit
MSADNSHPALPHTDCKKVGAADFYFAINATFRFIENQFGYACALGLVIFAVILVLTFVNSRLVRTGT